MRRFALVAASLLILLAACGGGKKPRLTPADILRHADPGDVVISFCLSTIQKCAGAATPAEEHGVEARIDGESCVRQSVFISSAVALHWLEKHNPAIAASANSATGLPSEPDSLTVVPAKPSCGSSIAAGLERAHLRGVAKISVIAHD